jgi:hypothetical protein
VRVLDKLGPCIITVESETQVELKMSYSLGDEGAEN